VTGIQPWIPTLSDYRKHRLAKNARDKPSRTYAVYARGLDPDQSFATGEGGFGYLLEFEYGFDGTLLCEPESVHGGSEHRGEEAGIDAMV